MISPVSPFLIPILELIISVIVVQLEKKKGIRAGLPLPLSPPYPAGAAAISPINDKEGKKKQQLGQHLPARRILRNKKKKKTAQADLCGLGIDDLGKERKKGRGAGWLAIFRRK